MKANKKIIFVGIHYKPGMDALDSRTRSGKLIDKIIEHYTDRICIKSNIFNLEHMPTDRTKEYDLGWVENWKDRVNYQYGDVIVCLGQMVRDIFDDWRRTSVPASLRPIIINFGHPSAVWRKQLKDDYVGNSVVKINTILYHKHYYRFIKGSGRQTGTPTWKCSCGATVKAS
jgi:hypothetical protein